METVVNISGFTVFPLKLAGSSSHGHYLYIKENRTREKDANKPDSKTLFVNNVPPYIAQEHLEEIFSSCGKISKIFIQKSPTISPDEEGSSSFFPNRCQTTKGFRVAYVVFQKSSSLKLAMMLSEETVPTISTPIVSGVRKWVISYKSPYVDTTALQKDIDEFMAPFEEKESEEIRQMKEQADQVDEDGWVTVSKFSRKRTAPRTETQDFKVKKKLKERNKEKELLNFYSFQIRETKKNRIDELRMKFEDDKKRISEMRAARKFRPY